MWEMSYKGLNAENSGKLGQQRKMGGKWEKFDD